MRFEWLNYHHLLYFWVVAREGGIARASDVLGLAQPTISAQIKQLERDLGESLFTRTGRRLILTETGKVVYRYCDEIFMLGRELQETLKGRPSGRPMRLNIGIADVIPKLVAQRLIRPVLELKDPVRVICREDKPERLALDLASHALDVLIADAPLGPEVRARVFYHELGDSSVSFFGRGPLAQRVRRGFPAALDGAPVLLPTQTTSMRRGLDQFFATSNISPEIVGEFDDSALMKVFGQEGWGIFPAPTLIAEHVQNLYDVEQVGELPQVREKFLAITLDRRIKHPAVAAMTERARQLLTL